MLDAAYDFDWYEHQLIGHEEFRKGHVEDVWIQTWWMNCYYNWVLISSFYTCARMSHLKIPILECEQFSTINLIFQNDFIWFKLKYFYLFFYFVFKWVQRIKIFKWCSKFLLNDSFNWVVKIFKQNLLSPKVYSKEFSYLNIHSKRFTKVYNLPP
jgi:hypothetical protein